MAFLRLPIGYDDFGALLENQFDFVDKSLFIRDILNDPAQVILITRPRRFGKTLNLSMLRYFLAAEVIGQKTQGLFDDLKIAQECPELMARQGQFPVIFITFKDLKNQDFTSCLASLATLLSRMYSDFYYLLDSDLLHPQEKNLMTAILQKKAEAAELQNALLNLCNYLYRYHHVKPWLLIDEYDTPVQSAYVNGYYDELVGFFRNFFSAALKTNPYLYKAVLTGVTRVSKESFFSGLNNIEVYSLLEKPYREYFGFTEAEVNHLLKQVQLEHTSEEIKNWYNGYNFGGTTLYNPWSIVHCVKNNGSLKPYWVNTSDNHLLSNVIIQSNTTFKQELAQLLQGYHMEKYVDEHVVFPEIHHNEDAAWSVLVATGYLTTKEAHYTEQGMAYSLQIPNQEVRYLYRKIIEEWLSHGYSVSQYNRFLAALLQGDITGLQEHLGYLLGQTISVHDVAKEGESFYHGLLLGLTASLHRDQYEVKSNRESGLGRYDIMILPKEPHKLGIILEIKHVKKPSHTENLPRLLEQAAEEAIHQIHQKQYATELHQKGLQKTLALGIAFCGKEFKVVKAK